MANSRKLIEGFWDRFDDACENAGYSKYRLSKEIGCNRKSLYGTSGYMLSPLFIARASIKLGVSTDYLLGVKREKQ